MCRQHRTRLGRLPACSARGQALIEGLIMLVLLVGMFSLLRLRAEEAGQRMEKVSLSKRKDLR